ncbi:MAG: DUF177 domain-containing protein, partial [Elusimicrobia bacterium]|nr:DUF177 domain-containing protein [Elusimicrobiota bacterium]
RLNPFVEQARLVGPVSVALRARWSQDRAWISGRASGRWEMECCRCLARQRSSYGVPIEAEVEDPGAEIDALEETRQALLLAVPTRSYCRADCKGLCPSCGANRNETDCRCPAPPKRPPTLTRRGHA